MHEEQSETRLTPNIFWPSECVSLILSLVMATPTDVSMVPLILPTDKPVVKKSKVYKPNDIVVARHEGRLVAHRIIYIFPDGSFQTKGDNNLASDGKIKKSRILGKVERVIRGGQSISLSHVYLSQSSTYLKELSLLNNALKRTRIAYVLLKGLPLHLAHGGKLPQRLYFDTDILIKRKNQKEVERIFAKLGFESIQPKLLGKAVRNYSQISFVKKIKPFPVIIDIHFSPGIGFTKATGLNRLIPSLARYTKDLFESAKEVSVEGSFYPMLNKEDLFLYLLLHLFHHNFQGIHRIEFIAKLNKSTKPDMEIVVNKAKIYGYEYFIYPAILILNRFFDSTTLPENLKTPYPVRIISNIVFNSSPFDDDKKAVEGVKRFLFIFSLSRASILRKLSVLFSQDVPAYFFPTIKSAFFKV